MTEIETYITTFSIEVQEHIHKIRSVIMGSNPGIVESFNYGMLAYKLNKKPLVYFGSFKHHIGFYATPNEHLAFKVAFSSYKQGKGSVQFPLDKPIPFELIKRVVEFRIESIINPQKS